MADPTDEELRYLEQLPQLAPKPECYWDICEEVDNFRKTHTMEETLYLIELLRETLEHFEGDIRARQAMN